LRRTVAQRDAAPLASYRFGPFTLDAVARTLNFVRAGQANQEPIDLTSAEFKLLMAFAQNPRQTLSREELTRAVQPGNYEPLARAVDVQIARLRKKLLAAAPEHDLIATVRGEGYVFTPPRA
jgi:DNA-binding response OmpR family regulator